MLSCRTLLRVRPTHTKHTGPYVPNKCPQHQGYWHRPGYPTCCSRCMVCGCSMSSEVLMANWALPTITAQLGGHCLGCSPRGIHMNTVLQSGAWHLLAQLKCFSVNPRLSETEAGFQFNQVKCQLLFIIRNSFNRFPAWALGSQRGVQDREISPALSSCLPEMAVFTLYIVSPMHLAGLSNPFHDLQLGPLEIIRTKCHKVYKQEDALEKYALVWVRLTSSFEYFPSVSWPERC